MRISRYIFMSICATIIFLSGRLSVKPEIIEKEVKVNYWDMTTLTEEKVEVAANYFGKTIQDAKEVNEIHKKNKAELDNRKDEAERITHWSYQQGYQQGFRDGRRK